MRTPPVWRSRFVGLLIRSDRVGSARSTSTASVTPNASTSSGLAVGSGKCRRVADATPSSLWQPRHWAASKIGYSVLENEIGPATDCCAEMSAATTAAASTHTIYIWLLAPIFLSRAERHARRGPRSPRHRDRRMRGSERRNGVGRHVRFAH